MMKNKWRSSLFNYFLQESDWLLVSLDQRKGQLQLLRKTIFNK